MLISSKIIDKMAEKTPTNLQISAFTPSHAHHPHHAGLLGIDHTDARILRILQRNARTPFLEIARELKVSGATVHERVRNLEKAGIIEGFTARINCKKLGYGITALVSVTLEHPIKDLAGLTDGLLAVPEIIEAHNLTGDTDMLLKIKTRSIDDLRDLLTKKVQNLPGVRRLSTSIVLDSPVQRPGIML
jgi:Lrp/AsnC family transcriptional regulator for asnA, asnC and gidA